MADQKKGSGGRRKIGRAKRKPSHLRYNAMGQRDTNKRKRILQSNGAVFLQRWEAMIRRGRKP